MTGPSRVWHWYDFACPYSYVAQARNAGLRRLGLCPELLPYSVRMETGPAGALGKALDSSTHQFLEHAAHAAGLVLRWPTRVPNTRDALRVVEWVRQYQPDLFEPLHQRVFAAHFALGADISDLDLIYSLADHHGVDITSVRAAIADGTAEAAVVLSESAAKRRGVTGPPEWCIGDRVITGIDSPALRSICVTPVTASRRSGVRR